MFYHLLLSTWFHTIIVFVTLSVVFTTYTSRVIRYNTQRALDNMLTNLGVSRLNVMPTPTLQKLVSTPSEVASVNNHWLFRDMLTISGFLVVGLLIVLVLRFEDSLVPLQTTLATCVLVGVIEIVFITTVATKYKPFPDTFILKSIMDDFLAM